MHRRWVVGALIAAFAVVPLIGGVAYGSFGLVASIVDSYRYRVTFDPQHWRDRTMDKGVMWPTRLRMADDLVRRQLISGITRSDVEHLLGPPDESQKFQDWHLVYHLGPERGLIRIDSEWLVVRFSKDGRVADHRIVRD